MKFIDVHCFAGAHTLGAVQAGFQLAGKHEGKDAFGAPLCEANRALLGDDWRGQYTHPANWEPLASDVSWVGGNPPCSGFSRLTPNRVTTGVSASINSCMNDLIRIAAEYRPEVVTFESVAAAGKSGLPLMRALRAELEWLTGAQYGLTHVFHSAASVGADAVRRRYFFVASRVPFGIELPHQTHARTVTQILAGLPRAETGWDGEPDGHTTLCSPALNRMRSLAEIPGAWLPGEMAPTATKRVLAAGSVLPAAWYRDGRIPDLYLIKHGWNTRRLHGGKLPPVLNGGALVNRFHPSEPRPITFRECARLMGFPDEWTLQPCRKTPMANSAWFGKGVVVGCARWLGHWTRMAIDGTPGPDLGIPSPDHDREWTIDITNAYRRPA